MRELYNAEYKRQFIESLPAYKNDRVKKNYENLFYSIGKFEKQLIKDFCEMSVPEAKMVIASLGMVSMSSTITTITLLRDYNNWCISTGKTNYENSLLKIQSSDLDLSFAIQCRLLKSPKQLNEILKAAFKDEETGYQKQSKLIAWLLYFGFQIEQIKHFTIIDIETFEKIVEQTPNEAMYYRLILDLMKECSVLHEIKTYGGKGGSEKVEYLIDSEYILRSKINSRSDPKGVLSNNVILDRIRDINIQYSNATGILIELTVDRITRSGIFYKMYQCEQNGKEITQDFVYDLFHMDYQNETTIKNTVSKKMKDYANWKKAFDL